IDQPTTATRDRPHASSTSKASRVSSSSVYGGRAGSLMNERPVSRWSYRTTRQPPSTNPRTNPGGQTSPGFIAPMINNTGKPSTGPVASLQSTPPPGTFTVRHSQIKESMWSVMPTFVPAPCKRPARGGPDGREKGEEEGLRRLRREVPYL